MIYTCPKCHNVMYCVALMTSPISYCYECPCGYQSKVIHEPAICMPLPEEYREDEDDED